MIAGGPRRRAMIAALLALPGLLSAQADKGDYRSRLPQDEVIYFVLPDRFDNADPSNDRGGLQGPREVTGFDPSSKGFYHGGDLKGLTKRLDYIQRLGVTALWVGPVFTNKPVQGPPGQESAAYHGYWITNFTHVDPHLGTDADFKTLVDTAHARGMKVYMDIVVNHTADVIQYRECQGIPCPYRSRADYPYRRRGGPEGPPINTGFAGDQVATAANYAAFKDPDFAYTPFVPRAEKQAKTPAWLNDPIYYHNRGNSTFAGESSTMGDFFGLDDLMTEHPRVVAGMIEIYGAWIDRFGIDGFRIDTARHVNPEFWQAFVPAMLARARAKGIPHFHIFGEVAIQTLEAGPLARYTRVDKLPAVLDFAFRRAMVDTVAGTRGTDIWEAMFAGDALYDHGFDTTLTLPTFVGNHDDGRFATFVRRAFPRASDDEVLRRVMLANAIMLTLRGVPTIYAGDEQGFVGDGNDQDAREDMMASQVASYNDNRLLGTRDTGAHFDVRHSLYRQIATLARLRASHPALRRGRQIVRASDDRSGLLAVSRFDPATSQEMLLIFNTSDHAISRQVEVDVASTRFSALAGTCTTAVSAPGSITMKVPALSYAICESRPPRSPS